MKVFVTGATGLLGSHAVARLRAAGHRVRALVRPSSDDRFLREAKVELYRGDVTDPASLETALADCDALVHAAAVVVSTARPDSYRAVNVEGTRAVLEAAARQGVDRAVHVSSVAVYGGPDAIRAGRIDERAPVNTPLAAGEFYARSKREAETVARRFHERGRLKIAIVRPAIVYGERDRAVIPRLASVLRGPIGFTLGTGRREIPMVYAGNVAAGIVAALESPDAAGRAYNLGRDFPLTQRDFFGLIRRALGHRPRLVVVPYSLAYGAAWAFETAALTIGRRAPVVSRRRIAFLGYGNPFVSERARGELGWSPDVGHEIGVSRAVRWWMGERSRPHA